MHFLFLEAVDGAGNVYAVDARGGTLSLLTARGELKGTASLGDAATAVAAGPGELYVTTGTGRLLRIDPATARSKGEVPLAGGALWSPAAVVYEPSRMRIWVAERGQNRVRIVQPDGTISFAVQTAQDIPAQPPTGRERIEGDR